MAITDESVQTRSSPPRRRRDEVVQTAARVFHEKGYESTSIQDIADAVGILKGSLYYYMDSKEDLLYEILKGVHEEALANIRRRVEEVDGDALQKIRLCIVSHLVFNAENLTRMGVFFHDFRSLGGERRQEIIEARDYYEALLRRLIKQGQAEGTVCPDIDAKDISLGVMGMVNSIYQWYTPAGPHPATKIANEFADLVLSGIACTPREHEPGHRSRVGAL
jgi:TetR/AcrR family transcriptional regulator, cholesterol catabolism regulator